MTNSFQSTAFRSSAAPVETFVQQPRVLPKTNTEELADILKVVNPSIQKYLGLQIKKEADAAASKAINDALDDSTENFAETTKFLKSNEMIGGNIFYDKVYRRTKATILGGTIETNLKNSYRSTDIDGKPLSNFSLDSEEYQNWFSTEKNKVIDLLGDVDEDTFSKKFMPYLVNATNTMNEFHLKEHKAFQVDRLNTEAVGLAHSLIELNTFNPNADEFSKQKFNLFLSSINQFENYINKLGLSTTERSKLNKTILDSAADKAREIGYQTGDSDIALKIFDSINLFPYGSSGSLNLTNHPDYIDKRLELLEKVESYTASKDSRDAAKIKRLKDKNLSDGMFTAAKLFQAGEGEEANNLIEELKVNNPLLAAKIDSNVAALDGDTLERYAIMLENITSGNVYDTLADARTAVVSWFLDERTPKTAGNISKLNKLMTLTGSVDKGLLEPLNSYFTIYNDHSKTILQTDEKFQIYAKINKEKQLALQKLNFEGFKTEFREWKLESGDVRQEAINNKYKDHSERLCGIKELSPTDETPDFSTLVGIATSHHEAKASFARSKGEIVEDNFSPIFNSIVGDANAEFEKVRAETTDLVNRLENEGTNYLTTVTGVLNDAVENFDGTGNAGSFATEDVNNFDTALEFLNKISRASFFVGLAGSRNTHERFLVDNFIGDTNLKNLLEDADKEEDARLTFE